LRLRAHADAALAGEPSSSSTTRVGLDSWPAPRAGSERASVREPPQTAAALLPPVGKLSMWPESVRATASYACAAASAVGLKPRRFLFPSIRMRASYGLHALFLLRATPTYLTAPVGGSGGCACRTAVMAARMSLSIGTTLAPLRCRELEAAAGLVVGKLSARPGIIHATHAAASAVGL
jgi:hypothetical protein